MAILDNLVFYYDLSEASGTRNDSGPNALHLTDNNTVTGTTGPGNHNASLFTRANNESLSHATDSHVQLSSTDWTVAGWVNITTANDFQGIVCHGVATGNQRAWQIYQEGTTHDAAAQIFPDGVTGNGPHDTTFGDLGTGAWRFVVMQYVIGTTTIGVSTNNGTPVTQSRTDDFSSTGAFGFGWREEIGSFNLNGALAMWGMWKRALTATELTFLYNGGNGRSYVELASAFKKRNGAQAQSRIVQRRSINMAV